MPNQEETKKNGGQQEPQPEQPQETLQDETQPENTEPQAPEQSDMVERGAFDELKGNFDELNEKYLRMAAEYDNYRKRTQKEKDALYADAQMATLKELLPVLDNLEHALACEGDEQEPFRKGVALVLKSYQDILTKMGVSEIDNSVPFDPAFHYAIAHVEDESLPENAIAEVMQKGYLFKDRVLRYSMVKVAN